MLTNWLYQSFLTPKIFQLEINLRADPSQDSDKYLLTYGFLVVLIFNT